VNASMQAIGDANHEAVQRSQSLDSIASLQATLGEAGLPQKARAVWAARWDTVLVGQAAVEPPPTSSDAAVLSFKVMSGMDTQDDDLTLVVDVSHSVEEGRRRLEGSDTFGSVASLEYVSPGGLRCRPARISALMLQAAAANRSAAKSVVKSMSWATLRYGPKRSASMSSRGGLMSGLSVGRL
jgi:hypothetical protein